MAFVCCQLLQEVRPARLPHCSLPLDALCLSGVRRLHWVMIPNQNNYNNCLCEENQIKGFRTLGRDHTSGMFSLGSWKRLRRCFLCSSLRESGSRAWPQLISHPSHVAGSHVPGADFILSDSQHGDHNQVRLVPAIQGWFNIQKPINILYHTNRTKKQTKSLHDHLNWCRKSI